MKIVLIILVVATSIVWTLIGYQLDKRFEEIDYEIDAIRDEIRSKKEK